MNSPATAGTLSGKVAVITGAGRGIGRSIALGYAAAGAALSLAARTTEEVQETARLITDRGGRAIAQPADVRKHGEIAALFDATATRLGGIDLVVANAGVTMTPAPVGEDDAAQWEEVLNINLLGVYRTVRAAIPHLTRRGQGKIIIVGSGLGHRAAVGMSAYACSKAGAAMLARVLAAELAPLSITVNELIPGPVHTQMMGSRAAAFRQQVPLEWVKTPDDIVPLALFLATQDARGPTGQTFSLARRDL